MHASLKQLKEGKKDNEMLKNYTNGFPLAGSSEGAIRMFLWPKNAAQRNLKVLHNVGLLS